MPHFDQSSAECLVFTFKEGLLSAVAHDLEIRVGRFTVDVAEDGGSVQARFDAGSLRVLTAMRGGVESPGALSDADKHKIERNIADDVLAASRWPEIRFASTKIEASGAGHRVEGQLTLRDRTRPIQLSTRVADGFEVAEIAIHQPDFGIKPFSAMMGTLKIKPEIRIRIAVPVIG